jgi:hypothetical protein
MTPERRKTLTEAVDLIRAASNAESFDAPAIREALAAWGATFPEGNTNTIRLFGITASCTWDAGEHLLTRWAANARKALEEGEG